MSGRPRFGRLFLLDAGHLHAASHLPRSLAVRAPEAVGLLLPAPTGRAYFSASPAARTEGKQIQGAEQRFVEHGN